MIPSQDVSVYWRKFKEDEHLPLILQYQKELYSLNFTGMKFDELFYGNIRQWYTEGIQRQDCHSFLLFDPSGKLIGFYLFQKNNGTVYLMQMFVEKSYRGKGYGTLLLNHYERMGIRCGATSSFLHASSINAVAVSFYQRNRYIILSAEADEEGHPRFLMFKDLSSWKRP